MTRHTSSARLASGRTALLSSRKQELRRRALLKQQMTQRVRTQTPTPTQVAKVSVVAPTVDHKRAFDVAMRHFDKGKASAYLYWMGGETDPFERAIYSYVKELVKQQRAGNIYPSSSKLAKERIMNEQIKLLGGRKNLSPSQNLAIQEGRTIKYNPGQIQKLGEARYVGIAELSPSQNLALIENRDPQLTPAQRLTILKGKTAPKGTAELIARRDARRYFKEIRPDARVPKDSITTKEQKLATQVKIIPSNNPNKVIVTFPNGLKGFVKKVGRVIVGAAKAGHSYIFENGRIVSVDGVNVLSEQRKRSELAGKIVKDIADIVTKAMWKYIKKVNKKLTLTGKITKTQERKLTFELVRLQKRGKLSKRDTRIKNDIIEILEKGEIKILKGEVDLGGRAIIGKLVSRFPSYAKLFSKTGKDFGKVGKGDVIKEINTLKDFRQGQLSQAYLKAKNAQLKDLSFGSFVTIGGKLSGRVLKELNKKLKQVNIDPKDVTISRYAQSFKVPSNVPKTEALIKILKTGRMFTQKQLNKIPKFYNFKREGVLVTKQLPEGNVRVVAMEYNRIGNKISYISYKIGTGTDTFAVVNTFKKIRKLSTKKEIRVKHTGSAIVKSKIISQEKIADDIKKTISQMKTKKVFFNGKRLTRSEIDSFVNVLKSESRLAMNKNLGKEIGKLYKKSPDYNISSIANVVRVKRTLDKILFKSGKKKGRTQGVSRRGDFLEIGFTKRRIASDRKVRIIGRAKVSPVAARRVAKLKPVDKLGRTKVDNTIRVIAKGVSKSTQGLVKLEVKKGATKSQATNVKNAVMSIQTIVRPVLKSPSVKITRSKIGSIKSNVKKMLPGLSKASQTSLVALTRSLTALQKIDKLAKTSVQKNATTTITKRIFKSFSGLRPVPVRIFKKPPATPKPRPKPRPTPRRPPIRPGKKKPPIIPFKLRGEDNTRRLAKPVQTYGFVIKKGGRMVRLKMPPLTLRDAWDTGSYVLDHKLQRTGNLIPVGMNDVVAKLGKNVAGYYRKHSKKFRRSRIKKGKVLSLERTIIEKVKFNIDTVSEKRELRIIRDRALRLAKRKIAAKRKPSKKPPVKRKVARVRKPVARRGVAKRRTTTSSLAQRKEALIKKRRMMLSKLKATRRVNRRR